jgi:asparagine synthase (glutamine-hydrolysing)
MSGICGIVRLDGAQADRATLELLLGPLRPRGPEGCGVWIGKGAALGHTLLATTPEAMVESLPLRHSESGCTITADVRLDNREELTAKLKISAANGIGDGELILLAYFTWGEDCADHLLGDFAFAIWDDRAQRLFCARDQMGMRQLTYCHLPGKAFIFATEPASVLRDPSVPQELNLGRIADFLDNLEHFDLSATFYAAVSRLPPAHSLVVDAAGLRLRKYWTLAARPALKLKSDEEYVDAFLDVFENAVRCRLRSPGPVGSMLSGGIDSSSVTAVAAQVLAEEGRGPLLTFSGVGANTETCPETRAIYAAARIAGIEPHFISYADLDSYRADLIRLTKEQAEPFDGEMVMLRAIYLAAHRLGLKSVLDGVGGDIVFYSDSWAARLLRRGRPLQAWKEIRGERHFWGSTGGLLAGAAARAWIPRQARALRRQIAWRWRDWLLGRSTLISADFATTSGLRQRRRHFRRDNSQFDRFDENERARRIENPRLFVGRERYDRVASSVAVEPRDPFIDLRVIDFCLSLPWEQLQSGGWPKLLLRRAMASKLPEEVRWRQGKEHLGSSFIHEIFRALAATELSSGRFRETIGPYVDLGRVHGGPARERCKDWVDSLCLHYWLERAKGREQS